MLCGMHARTATESTRAKGQSYSDGYVKFRAKGDARRTANGWTRERMPSATSDVNPLVVIQLDALNRSHDTSCIDPAP